MGTIKKNCAITVNVKYSDNKSKKKTVLFKGIFDSAELNYIKPCIISYLDLINFKDEFNNYEFNCKIITK